MAARLQLVYLSIRKGENHVVRFLCKRTKKKQKGTIGQDCDCVENNPGETATRVITLVRLQHRHIYRHLRK
jgi:hypothetical protein